MDNKIVFCKPISDKYREELKRKVDSLVGEHVRVPFLAVIQVGDNPASTTYVRNKKIACEQVGIMCEVIKLGEDITQELLENFIKGLNDSEKVDGLFVQFPLPNHLDEQKVAALIDPTKDVDGFHMNNVGKLQAGTADLIPCTPLGITHILDEIGVDCTGKHCVIIGRSEIVGKPMIQLMLQKHATVTVCHSKTANLSHFTKEADILIVAIGKAKFITADMVKKGAVVIDVGINRDENNKLCGDILLDAAMEDRVSKVTPVPGGVGVMTVTMLMRNVIKAYESRV